jgi:hypothetical protein
MERSDPIILMLMGRISSSCSTKTWMEPQRFCSKFSSKLRDGMDFGDLIVYNFGGDIDVHEVLGRG